jgi:DNA-binding MarR family transcriptional regulator
VEELSELEVRAWRAFLGAHARVVRRLDAELQEERELTLNAYEVLLWLRNGPGMAMRMSELARRVLLSPSGATRSVDQLVRRGFVERRSDSEDARAQLAVLTQRGREALRAAAPTHLRGIRDHFTGHLTSTELTMLASVLESVVRAESCAGRDSNPRPSDP